MHNVAARIPFSPVTAAAWFAAFLGAAYLALIAVVMSYAAHTIDTAQSVRADESAVAVLEAQYLDSVQAIGAIDYAADGYAKPSTIAFVPAQTVTALR